MNNEELDEKLSEVINAYMAARFVKEPTQTLTASKEALEVIWQYRERHGEEKTRQRVCQLRKAQEIEVATKE